MSEESSTQRGKAALRILLLDADANTLAYAQEQFSKIPDFSIELDALTDADQALQKIRETHYSIHFVGMQLGRFTGLDVMLETQKYAADRLFVFMTDDGDDELAQRSIKFGALDYLHRRTITPGKLRGMLHGIITESLERAERIRKLHDSIFDALTGTHNGESFCRVGAHLIASNITCTTFWGVIYVDVDGFNHINSDMGRLEGDDTLRAIAQIVRKIAGPSDLVGRIANDELCVLRCIEDGGSIRELAWEVQAAVDKKTSASVSVGVAFAHSDDARLDDMIFRAKEAMLRARRYGGNRVTCEEE